jgi:integrase
LGKLADHKLQSLIDAKKPIAGKSDGDGLTFTLSRGGTATWVLRYRVAGRQRELTLGNYPDMGLKAARVAARAARVRVDQGADVAAEKRRSRVEAASAGTFKELGEDYLLRAGPVLGETTRAEVRRYLTKDIVPRIGHLSAAAVTGADIVMVVERVASRSDSVARRTFEILSVIFGHGVAKLSVKSNPCAGLKLEAILGPRPARRERVNLDEAQLRKLFEALPNIGKSNALAVKILLATCVRKGELLKSRPEHLDFEAGTWTVPDEHSKSKKGFVIPMAGPVAGWFRELRELAPHSKWVLPGQRHSHKSRTTLNVALDRLPDDVIRFSPHDLRSTARSHLARLGVSLIVAERCLNHSLGGLVSIYDKHDYLEERRRALELWASVLVQAEKASSAKVVALRKVA